MLTKDKVHRLEVRLAFCLKYGQYHTQSPFNQTYEPPVVRAKVQHTPGSFTIKMLKIFLQYTEEHVKHIEKHPKMGSEERNFV